MSKELIKTDREGRALRFIDGLSLITRRFPSILKGNSYSRDTKPPFIGTFLLVKDEIPKCSPLLNSNISNTFSVIRFIAYFNLKFIKHT